VAIGFSSVASGSRLAESVSRFFRPVDGLRNLVSGLPHLEDAFRHLLIGLAAERQFLAS
jgi:hypothetical protein